jgi:hypothetical protein
MPYHALAREYVVNVPVRSAHAEHYLLNLKNKALQRHVIA